MLTQLRRVAWSSGWVLALVVLALGVPGTAVAGSYTFTLIADTSGVFTHLHSPPAINASGRVVFTGDLAAGGSGVFTGSGGALTTIAESGGPFLWVGGNTINADGTVVVWASLAAGGDAIMTGDGGSLSAIADTTTFTWLCCRASISDDGTVAFSGTLDGVSNIFTRAVGGSLTSIVPGTGALKPTFTGPAPTIDSAGVVVFAASMPGVGFSLYTGSGAAPPALIVDRLSGGFFDFGIRPAIAAGLVAFEGVRASGIHGIYMTRGGLVTTIADNAAIFFDFVDPAVNSLGEVAFVAGLVGGDWAMFSGSHPVVDRVIGLNDSLFDSTMVVVDVLRGGINDAGQIAFWAGLANGRQVIVRADPVADTGTGQPDLVVTVLTAPTEGTAGRPIDVAVTVANVGARKSPPSRLGFYLSTDSAILPDDLSIGGPCEVPPLSPGATVSCRGELLLPFVPAGTYHVGAIVDDVGAVVESDETNNARSADGGAIAIDVRCAAISAASRLFFEPGGTGTLAVTASADCSWTAVSDAGWLTVTSDASGVGNGTVAYTVAENPVAIDRAATLVIGDNVFAVSQRAATCNYYFLSYHGGSLSDPAGGVGDFGVTTLEGCAWTAQSGASWLTITAGSPGVGPGQADLSTAPNPTFQSRTAMVTLAGHTVSVTQAGMPCVYSVSPPGSSFLPAGGSSTVAVTSQAGCAWTAGSDAPWAVIGASSGGGSGNGVVAYSVAANSSVSARTATLTIAGQAVAVTQTGCSSALSSTSKSAPAAGGDESITVTASAACTWTTQSGAGWIQIVWPSSAAGSALVAYSVAANPAITVRSGTLTIAGQSVTVTQAGAPCAYSLSSTALSVASSGGPGSVGVLTLNGCGWGVMNGVTWIGLVSGASGSGAGTVSFTVSPNATVGTRMTSLSIAGKAFWVTQAAGMPDLVPTAFGNLPAAVLPGATFTATDTVRNQGLVTAAASTTRYYLSLDAVKSADDLLLPGSRPVPILAAGASSTATVTLSIPVATALGAYYVVACADAVNAVAEASETDNCRASATTVQITRPDLVEIALGDPPAVAAPGGRFAVADTVRNQGAVASLGSTTRYYLSADAGRGAGDVLLSGTRAVPVLAANGSAGGSVTVTIPTTVPAGLYFLLACADDMLVVVEVAEANNCLASAGRVQVAKPDLVTTAVSDPPQSAARGSNFTVTDTVENHGGPTTVTSTTRYYLSLDVVKGSTDKLLSGTHAVPILGAGAASSGTAVVTIPSNTPLGTYVLLACADDAGGTVEGDEINNCKASLGSVLVQ
jgi:hypothetical protein